MNQKFSQAVKILALSLWVYFSMSSHEGWAISANSADPSAHPPGGSILEISRNPPFSVDERLKKNVDFWIQIYGRYTTRQGVIHDAKYIDHVYEILDFDKNGNKTSEVVRSAKKRWKAILLSVHKKQGHPEEMTEAEKRIFRMFEDVKEPNKFLNATHRKRLRFQLGQKDRFLDGLIQSGKYLPVMEEVFKRYNMPRELTRLPFVESSFNIKARSKVGASGVWQFMRSTARLFIQINEAVDERNDPIRATEAAAQLLKLNYESLRSWPLAVTAYNHGRKGMMRAVRKVGSEELEELVASYKSRSFGFASSNFFSELLAAIEVEKNAAIYFGEIARAKPITYFEVKLPDYIDFRELIRQLNIETSQAKELNPGLTEAAFVGALRVPAGYVLRVPYEEGITQEVAVSKFWERYKQIPKAYKLNSQRATKYDTKERLDRN
jgi:membrane-bound lytic murein transglycosylase D